MKDSEILIRLYKDYTKKYLNKIFIALIFAIILAGSTSSIAYFFTFAMFRGREAYRNYSRKIKLFAAIYSGLSLIVLNLLVYGKNII